MEENIPLSDFTTFKIGGPARYFFRVKTIEEINDALNFSRINKIPFFVLGAGSNLLVNDKGFEGVVIKNEITGTTFSDNGDFVDVTAGAGMSWDQLVSEVVAKGLYGLENLSGIPGTVGASPVQNIGAYGVEAKDTILNVETIDSRTGDTKIFDNQECHFGYRDSFFKTAKGRKFVIVKVCFRLNKTGALNLEYKDLKNFFKQDSFDSLNGDNDMAMKELTPSDVRVAVLKIRSLKFPDLKTIGTAGSFFKNPIVTLEQYDELKKTYPNLPGFLQSRGENQLPTFKVSLAWILDNICGLKGYVRKNNALFCNQPIVVVNNGGATAESTEQFVNEVARTVFEKTGIKIDWEVEKL